MTCLGNSSCISGWLRNGNATPEQRSFVNVNFGSMGDDIPLAEGVAAASGKPVNIVCGDGAFMMNSQELATVMHNRLPIRIVVFSNGGYGSLSRTWKRYFNGVSEHPAQNERFGVYGISQRKKCIVDISEMGKHEICIPKPRILVQGILRRYCG